MFSLGTIPSSTSYCLPGMSPKRMMTAWSASSSIFMSTRCHGVPLTFTERPFDKTSDTICTPLDDPFEPSAPVSSSSSFVIPREARDCSTATESEETSGEERRKVAETDVISRTESDRDGRQGRIECHCEWSFMAGVPPPRPGRSYAECRASLLGALRFE